jgi:hypothetical protein
MKSIQDSIKYVCKVLSELGVVGLTPEAFRLAKTNDDNHPMMEEVVCYTTHCLVFDDPHNCC